MSFPFAVLFFKHCERLWFLLPEFTSRMGPHKSLLESWGLSAYKRSLWWQRKLRGASGPKEPSDNPALPQSAVCVEAIFRPLVLACCCVGELSHQEQRVLVFVPASPAWLNCILMTIKISDSDASFSVVVSFERTLWICHTRHACQRLFVP